MWYCRTGSVHRVEAAEKLIEAEGETEAEAELKVEVRDE